MNIQQACRGQFGPEQWREKSWTHPRTAIEANVVTALSNILYKVEFSLDEESSEPLFEPRGSDSSSFTSWSNPGDPKGPNCCDAWRRQDIPKFDEAEKRIEKFVLLCLSSMRGRRRRWRSILRAKYSYKMAAAKHLDPKTRNHNQIPVVLAEDNRDRPLQDKE